MQSSHFLAQPSLPCCTVRSCSWAFVYRKNIPVDSRSSPTAVVATTHPAFKKELVAISEVETLPMRNILKVCELKATSEFKEPRRLNITSLEGDVFITERRIDVKKLEVKKMQANNTKWRAPLVTLDSDDFETFVPPVALQPFDSRRIVPPKPKAAVSVDADGAATADGGRIKKVPTSDDEGEAPLSVTLKRRRNSSQDVTVGDADDGGMDVDDMVDPFKPAEKVDVIDEDPVKALEIARARAHDALQTVTSMGISAARETARLAAVKAGGNGTEHEFCGNFDQPIEVIQENFPQQFAQKPEIIEAAYAAGVGELLKLHRNSKKQRAAQ